MRVLSGPFLVSRTAMRDAPNVRLRCQTTRSSETTKGVSSSKQQDGGHGSAYVTLNAGVDYSEDLRAELKQKVRAVIGPIATPDVIHWAPALPKTRSGKIMRRILRKIATNETDQIGDVSTLADPSVVESLIASR